MSRDEILSRFPNASESFIRQNCSEGNWPRPRTEFQKQSAVVPHKQAQSNLDAQVHGEFRVTITFHMSDLRPRDIDGGCSTILDCLCAARRQLENYSGIIREGGAR